jgi:hypothetical protein
LNRFTKKLINLINGIIEDLIASGGRRRRRRRMYRSNISDMVVRFGIFVGGYQKVQAVH